MIKKIPVTQAISLGLISIIIPVRIARIPKIIPFVDSDNRGILVPPYLLILFIVLTAKLIVNHHLFQNDTLPISDDYAKDNTLFIYESGDEPRVWISTDGGVDLPPKGLPPIKLVLPTS